MKNVKASNLGQIGGLKMENKRLFRTVKKYDNEEKFINHVLSFLRFYQVPKWWTKESLRQYWRDYHEATRGI